MASSNRQEVIRSVIIRAQYTIIGKGNEVYYQRLAFIDSDNTLTPAEKSEAKNDLRLNTDRENLFYIKDKTHHKCDACGRLGYMMSWCQHCVTDFLREAATKWTSGNEYVDRKILQVQLRTPIPGAITEWIPYDLLNDVRYLTEGGCATIYSARYMRGLYSKWNEKTRTLSRGPVAYQVVLKRLNTWDQSDVEFGNEVCVANFSFP